jgi:hypothetical protein
LGTHVSLCSVLGQAYPVFAATLSVTEGKAKEDELMKVRLKSNMWAFKVEKRDAQ